MLRILQWNARSLIANGQEFKSYIDQSDFKPDIICIQESWLKVGVDFKLHQYIEVRCDRSGGVGGGCVTFIKNNINFRIVEIGKEEEEFVIVEVFTNQGKICIINYYNPCKRLEVEKIRLRVGINSRHLIVCGDFNAHSTVWGARKTDMNGEIMEQIMEEANLVCINDGRGTRIDVYTGKMSALDITLVSSELAGISEWEVLEDTIGSDHCLILTNIFETRGMIKEGREGRWIFKRAKWDLFRNICDEWSSKVMVSNKVEEIEEAFRSVIIEAAELTIPKTKGNIRERKNVPWWSEVCEKAIKARNKSLKILRKTHNVENLLKYKKLQAEVRRVVKKAKRESWRNFCGKIGRTTPISNVWGMIRKMKGLRREWNFPVLKVGDELAITNNEKVEVLVKTFVKIHSTDNLSEERRERREATRRKNEMEEGGCEEDNIKSTMDMFFSLFELERALAKTGMTSPGKDQVCYIMLKQIGKQMKLKLLEMYNIIWKKGKLPKNWKEAIIVPIIKVGKELSSPDSYRPIALTSHIGKVMERMVVDRLTDYLERNKKISQYQSGFRKGRGTMDAIVYLETEIRKALINKESLVVVFFDVEKAYDMVWKEGLLIKLKKNRSRRKNV